MHIPFHTKKIKSHSKNLLPAVLISPTIIVLAALVIFPLLFLLYLSLYDWRLGTPFGSRIFIGLNNYFNISTDKEFWNSVWNTMVYVFSVVSVELLLGLAMAIIVLRLKQTKFLHFLNSVILLPMMVTPVVAGLMWRLLYNNDLGMINYLLRGLSITGPLWLTDKSLALVSIMIVDVWEWTPFMFLVMLSGLSSLPKDPFEAAKVDGGSSWQIFKNITLPLLRPTILVGVLIRGMDAMKIFDQVFVLTSGGPGNSTEVLSLYTYRQAFIQSQLGYASALSVVISIIITIISIYLIKAMTSESMQL